MLKLWCDVYRFRRKIMKKQINESLALLSLFLSFRMKCTLVIHLLPVRLCFATAFYDVDSLTAAWCCLRSKWIQWNRSFVRTECKPAVMVMTFQKSMHSHNDDLFFFSSRIFCPFELSLMRTISHDSTLSIKSHLGSALELPGNQYFHLFSIGWSPWPMDMSILFITITNM